MAVRVALALLLATAAVLLFDTVLTATVADAVHARLAELWAPPNPMYRRDPVEPKTLWPFVGTTLPGGIGLAGAFVVAAVGASRGWPWLRLAFRYGIPVIACCPIVGNAAFIIFPNGGDMTDSRIHAAKQVVPLWIQVAWGIDATLYFAFVVAAAILLGLPSAAAHFQTRRQPPITQRPG